MNTAKLLGLAAGLAALAACGKGNEANNMATDLNATDNLAVPSDNLTNVDMNAGMTSDMNMTNDMNATGNAADNTVNAY